VEIPLVSVGDDGRVFTVGGNEGKTKFELVNTEKRKLTLGDIPFSLTCALHQDCVLVDPTSKEESIIESSVTVVVDSSDRLVSVQNLEVRWHPRESLRLDTLILPEFSIK
jgi:exosome complex component RRP43